MSNRWFGTDGVRGVANVFPLTVDFAMKLGMAAGKRICTAKKRMAIAKDTRVSSDMLEAALTAGFTSQGIEVVKLGIIPTPAVTMLTPLLDVDMAVMITASHNPYQDNGIKLIGADGCKFSDQVTAELEKDIEQNQFSFDAAAIGRVSENYTAVEHYIAKAMEMAPDIEPLKGLKVVLDCANGCFSQILPQVFQRLGAETEVLACTPNGYNVNCECGSTAIAKMQEKVRVCGAAIGIAVDGDGDRIIIADDKGQKINAEQIIAFLAQYLEEEGRLGGRPVVSTVLSNTALERFVKGLGVDYFSTKVGERYVVEKMNETNGAVGGEESGHVVVADYCKSGDALMVGLMFCMALLKKGRPSSEIFPLFEFDPFVFVNPRFETGAIVKKVMNDASVQKAIAAAEKQICNKGRVVVRPSGTEPLIRVWVSGEDADLVSCLSQSILEEIEKAI